MSQNSSLISIMAKMFTKSVIYFCVFLIVIIIRIIRPFILIRYGNLFSYRIGHFAGNTELYLCEKDAKINKPQKYTLDFFYLENPISNYQLMLMWKRVLIILPSWLLIRVKIINELIPGEKIHEVGHNANMDRDIFNLLDKYPSHLKFTAEEEIKGQVQLKKIGLPYDSKFVCLFVRDNTYLNSFQPEYDWSVHDYRDANIQNYILAIQELINRGYYVIRMGAKVKEPVNFNNPKFIDYAYNGMRTDFLDIYLGAKCQFCISSSSGWDAVPGFLFRKPVLITNLVPVGYLPTFTTKYTVMVKGHYSIDGGRYLSFSEIFENGLGYILDSSVYKMKKVKLIENSPEEIRDAVGETEERLTGTWKENINDEQLQNRFWKNFPKNSLSIYNGAPLHGEIRSKFSTTFLRKNTSWLR
jgi:putative glycosyltransferase (TIGR04372 family)